MTAFRFPKRPDDRLMGQALVHWLWAFLFAMAGVTAFFRPRDPKELVSAMVTRTISTTVFLTVGVFALIVTSLNLWRLVFPPATERGP